MTADNKLMAEKGLEDSVTGICRKKSSLYNELKIKISLCPDTSLKLHLSKAWSSFNLSNIAKLVLPSVQLNVQWEGSVMRPGQEIQNVNIALAEPSWPSF